MRILSITKPRVMQTRYLIEVTTSLPTTAISSLN
jgi:hypothetical protein